MTERLLEMLVYPLSLSLVMGLVGLAFLAYRRLRMGMIVIAMALTWLTLWSLPPVADLIGRSLESQAEDVAVEIVPTADVILVLGGVIRAERPGLRYPDLSAASDRIWHAARLYHAGKASKIILSGGRYGRQQHLQSEAAAMGDLLMDLGVPREVLILEERAGTTRENAIECSRLMRERRMAHALLVTSALHMPRAAAAMRAAGVDVTAVAIDFEAGDGQRPALGWLPESGALERSSRALHEWAGIVAYRWRGWL